MILAFSVILTLDLVLLLFHCSPENTFCTCHLGSLPVGQQSEYVPTEAERQHRASNKQSIRRRYQENGRLYTWTEFEEYFRGKNVDFHWIQALYWDEERAPDLRWCHPPGYQGRWATWERARRPGSGARLNFFDPRKQKSQQNFPRFARDLPE